MDENDDEYFGIDEGNEALREYASNLTDSEREELLSRLKKMRRLPGSCGIPLMKSIIYSP